jgi:hypothetical protein
MLPRPHVSLPIAELLPLLEAALLFVIQLLIAHHPDLLAPPDEATTVRPPPPLRAAHRLLDAVRELNLALDSYRDILPPMSRSGSPTDDDFPF